MLNSVSSLRITPGQNVPSCEADMWVYENQMDNLIVSQKQRHLVMLLMAQDRFEENNVFK